MRTQPDFTKKGKSLTLGAARAMEFLLDTERQQRQRDQARLAHAIIVALESGITIPGLAKTDDPAERNFLRRIVYGFERERVSDLKGMRPLGMDLEDEADGNDPHTA
jgi:hypothetical protein